MHRDFHCVSTHVFVGRLRVAMIDLTLDSQLDVIKRQIGNTSGRRPSTACMVGVYNSVLEYFVEVSLRQRCETMWKADGLIRTMCEL